MILDKAFYFVRHGETDWNKNGRYMGGMDIPLNQCGIEQANTAGRILKSREENEITHIVSSPLMRAKKTAEIIGGMLGIEVIVIDNLKECGWGVQEGKPHDNTGGMLKRWAEGDPHEGAEIVEDFSTRVLAGFNQALALPGTVLIVSHGGVYFSMQKYLGGTVMVPQNGVPLYHRPPEKKNLKQPWFVYPLV